jgi:L-rhamnose mutarotase
MAKRRTLSLRRLKPECIQTYVDYHQQVWPDLLDAYHQAGIAQIDCFLQDCDLVVYVEYDDVVYEKKEAVLSRDPVEIRWQELMETLRDTGIAQRSFEEVFHWES